jgi:hypothetical protein
MTPQTVTVVDTDMAEAFDTEALGMEQVPLLSQNPIYHELALRSQEYLQYQSEPPTSELRQLAEDTFFNLAVEYIVQVGVARPVAERFCDRPDNLGELALRLLSVLGQPGPQPKA